MIRLGFIGCGNMATAIIGGVTAKGLYRPQEIIGSSRTQASLDAIAEKTGITTTLSNREVAEQAPILFLCVKPQFLAQVIDDIRGSVREDQIIVSIAAGRSTSDIEALFAPARIRLVRLMPNTPALVGEAMTAACAGSLATEQDLQDVLAICAGFGRAEAVPERLFDAVTAVSGSSPAYVFLFIEAMADAAVSGGMPRKQAYEFAAQSVLGSAKMVLETGKHPGELKDMVTSPAGTTIEAVRVLEAGGLRSTVFEAVKACEEKSAEMGRKN